MPAAFRHPRSHLAPRREWPSRQPCVGAQPEASLAERAPWARRRYSRPPDKLPQRPSQRHRPALVRRRSGRPPRRLLLRRLLLQPACQQRSGRALGRACKRSSRLHPDQPPRSPPQGPRQQPRWAQVMRSRRPRRRHHSNRLRSSGLGSSNERGLLSRCPGPAAAQAASWARTMQSGQRPVPRIRSTTTARQCRRPRPA